MREYVAIVRHLHRTEKQGTRFTCPQAATRHRSAMRCSEEPP
jgi:hypothetical protein